MIRKYLRHQSNMPIIYDLQDSSTNQQEKLNNISLGGLSFRSGEKIDKESIIFIHFPDIKPAIKFKGSVVWCNKNHDGFDVGVTFFNNGNITNPEWQSRFISLNIIKNTIRSNNHQLNENYHP